MLDKQFLVDIALIMLGIWAGEKLIEELSSTP